jgi:DNA adenine methylase
MVGSGALFFGLSPSRAVLGDVNSDLVHFYTVLRRAPRKLYRAIEEMSSTSSDYYRIRAALQSDPILRAARFYYLVRLSWNGLYRVNRQGNFNVPFGGRQPEHLVTFRLLRSAAEALRSVRLVAGDFERVTKRAAPGDFVFFDPPYPRGARRDNGFARYTAGGFSSDEHLRLARYARHLAERGVHVVVAIAARGEFLQLYSGFQKHLLRTPSLIAASSAHRRDAYEAILTSYRVKGG